MSLMNVSSRFCSILLRRRLGTTYSCSGFELLSSSSSIGVVHFHSNCLNSSPNYTPHSTRIPQSYLKLQQLLNENKSGFNNLQDALHLFRKMLKMRPLPCVFHFNQLLTALVVMKQYPVAVSLFRDICTLRIPVCIITLNIAINCCCHSNRLDYAFSLLASIFKRGFVPNVVTYNTLIRGLLSQHKSAEARLLFTNLIKFKEIQPDVVTYSTMINGLGKTGHTDMALWLFRFMEKSDSPPNTVTYTAIIDSLCKHGLADDALNLHSEMMEKGILPNVWTYSPLFQVLCNFNRWEEVSLLLKQMIDDMKISPNVYTFSILVDAYSKSGKLDDAKEIIEMMKERGEHPNIVTYNILMQAYCAQGQMEEALAVLNIARSKGMRPNCYTYNILLDAYCRQLKLDIAMDIYRNMVAEGLEPTFESHGILLHGLCRLGKPLEALAFLYKIQDQGHMLNNVIYHTMLTGLCKNQYVDKALSLFHLMSCNGLIYDKTTYNVIICGCLCNKKYNEARKLVDEMVDCGFLADALTTSLLRQLLLSKVQNPSLLAMHQKCLHSVTYNILMQAYCAQGQMEEALAVLNTIRSKEMKPTFYTYNILLDAYCRQLKLDIAMDLYRNMVCEGVEPTFVTHNILIHGLFRVGRPLEALTFFYKIQDQGHMLNNVIYHTMLTGLWKSQYVHKALSLFHLMSCNCLIPDRDTYNIIIRGCLCNKKYNEARKLVDEMVDCGFLADALTTSLLRQLLLSKVQNPSLLAMHQKCLHSGQKRFNSVKAKEAIPAMHQVTLVDIDSEVNAGDTYQETET